MIGGGILRKMEKEIENLCFLASTANQISQFEEMISVMKRVVDLNPKLDHDQRVLLSTSFHEYVSEKRQDLIVLESCMEHISSEIQKGIIGGICNELRNKIHEICCDVLGIITEKLLPNNEESETQLFYYKMAADYYRYDAEALADEEKNTAIEKAEEMYAKAIDIAKESILYSHPLFLGLILNYCVFLVDLKGDVKTAKNIAQEVLKNADTILKEYPDLIGESEICITLLKDNLEIWEDAE